MKSSSVFQSVFKSSSSVFHTDEDLISKRMILNSLSFLLLLLLLLLLCCYYRAKCSQIQIYVVPEIILSLYDISASAF